MLKRTCNIILFFLFIVLWIPQAWAEIPSPKDFLGFEPGTARKLADAKQIVRYFERLSAESGRILVREVGKTTEGNPFILAVITSEENHGNLAKLRRYQELLADPRRIDDREAERIITEGKTVVMVNCSIHASEIGASQMSMQLAYDLAAGSDEKTQHILDNVILLLVPMHNPDGIQMVVDWYKKYVGTEYEGGRMPWLYQKYVGHDNNRDWYMFTQVESRLTIQVHNAWHPQIVVDMHQMGSRGARLFVPPYVDPYEPNVDPILAQQVAAMGTFIASELTAEGKSGVMHSYRFDAWTPARAYHHYHGGIRILTEAASVRAATPVEIPSAQLSDIVKQPSVMMPLPWPGGGWTLRDIVEYDYSAVMAVLTHAAGLRESWLRNFYRIHEKAVNRNRPPYAFIVPSDQRDLSAAVKMLQTLRLGGVEIHEAQGQFTADGDAYPAGSFIVYTAQPYGGYAKALLECQEYPEIRETPDGPLKMPYDVVAHTLPLLMGVEAIRIENPFEARTKLLDAIDRPRGRISGSGRGFGYAWSHHTNDDIVALNRLTRGGYQVWWAAESFEDGQETYPPGTMIVEQKSGLDSELKAIAGDLWVTFTSLKSKPDIEAHELRPIRLGLYKSWSASMDEGWTRWVLEQYEFPFQSIFDKDIRGGGLKKIDVLIIPDMGERTIVEGVSQRMIPPEYAGGIGEAGVENIRQFIEDGGTLVTLNGAAAFPIKRLYLAVENCVESMDRREFFIPGSILRVVNDIRHPVAYGFERESEVFFRRSPVFSAKEGRTVTRYPVQSPLLSGWINGEKSLYNRGAIADVPFGDGRIILIGFPAQYRAQSHGSFRYLFNAIYYGPSRKIRM